MELKTLFSPEKIGNVEIKNRIVRSATYTHTANTDGTVTDELIKFYSELAAGGTGLIITGIVAIDEEGKIDNRQAGLYNDSHIEGQKKFVKSIHEYSEVKIAPQLCHCGRQGRNSISPSAVLYQVSKKMPRELTNEEVRTVIKNFVSAGRRAYECEYDLVQLNGAHCWLLSNFLSPYSNQRSDGYGGNTENRTRILVEIYNQLRDEVGKNFPITIKLQTQDFVENSITLEEGKKITKILVDTGYDAIEPSGGGLETIIMGAKPYPSLTVKSEDEENYFLPTIKEFSSVLSDTKVILMGGVRDPLKVEEFLQEGIIDFIALGRPLIIEPSLPNRWKDGDLSPPLCTSCNACFGTIRTGSVTCPIKEKLLKERGN
jgi:2,4-dienoyl-CoA reductase-like NADH-dependent reductase (Old Yellow Enzyme family)